MAYLSHVTINITLRPAGRPFHVVTNRRQYVRNRKRRAAARIVLRLEINKVNTYRTEIRNKQRQVLRASPAACTVLCCVCACFFFFGPGRFSASSLVVRTQGAADRCSTTCWISVNSVCLLALSHSDRHVERASLLRSWLTAHVVDARRQHATVALGAGCAVFEI